MQILSSEDLWEATTDQIDNSSTYYTSSDLFITEEHSDKDKRIA